MDYFVRMSRRITHVNDKEQTVANIRYDYLPADSKRDADEMVKALHSASYVVHGNVFDRSFETVASVWSGKGRVYLDMMCLEQIADEYTNPERYVTAA